MTLEENIIFPDHAGFKGAILDDYLADGFYRIQHFMFTTHFTQIDINEEPLPVFWLRTRVNDSHENKTAASIRNRCNPFHVSCKPAYISQEIEMLYSLYRNYIEFNASDYCSSYLENIHIDNPFDSWMIEIRDGPTLIAVGYFDRGKKAMAGILNFYHPDYKKFSLGKYLMLLKIEYARHHKMTWYYTGYISTAIEKFDYKIFPEAAAMDVYLPRERVWKPYVSLGKTGLSKYVQDWKS